jgi:glucosamine-6-phosphate deaminase
MSRDELRRKILAIFKHQSQKDVAPFPGGHDEREFWQRVDQRNTETAAALDRLGLPEYHAMEAFVVARDAEERRVAPVTEQFVIADFAAVEL